MKIEPYNSEIGEEFRKIVKGNNFITPELYGYVKIIGGVAEISKSNVTTTSKFLPTYGVTIIKNNKKDNDLSKSFLTIEEVEDYINELNYEDNSSLLNILNSVSNE